MRGFSIIGETGEYSDRTEWTACVIMDESLAQAHILEWEAAARTRSQAWEFFQRDYRNWSEEHEWREAVIKIASDPHIRSLGYDRDNSFDIQSKWAEGKVRYRYQKVEIY